MREREREREREGIDQVEVEVEVVAGKLKNEVDELIFGIKLQIGLMRVVKRRWSYI